MKFVCLNPECKKTFLYAAIETTLGQAENFEKHVCPYCQSLDFDEVPITDPKIVSVASVDLACVDAKIAEGYEIKDLYSKTATMIKKA
jgi:hypothetical protein